MYKKERFREGRPNIGISLIELIIDASKYHNNVDKKKLKQLFEDIDLLNSDYIKNENITNRCKNSILLIIEKMFGKKNTHGFKIIKGANFSYQGISKKYRPYVQRFKIFEYNLILSLVKIMNLSEVVPNKSALASKLYISFENVDNVLKYFANVYALNINRDKFVEQSCCFSFPVGSKLSSWQQMVRNNHMIPSILYKYRFKEAKETKKSIKYKNNAGVNKIEILTSFKKKVGLEESFQKNILPKITFLLHEFYNGSLKNEEIKKSILKRVFKLLKEANKTEYPLLNGNNILQLAIINGFEELAIEFFLSNNKLIDNVNADGFTAMHFAVMNKFNTLFKVFEDVSLLKLVFKDDAFLENILKLAWQVKRETYIQNIDEVPKIIDICCFLIKNMNNINVFRSSDSNLPLLHDACMWGETKIVFSLLEKGANPLEREMVVFDNAITIAKSFENYHLLEKLYAACKSQNMDYFLQEAISLKDDSTAQLLVYLGADYKDIANEKYSHPLSFAIMNKFFNLAAEIYKHEKDPFIISKLDTFKCIDDSNKLEIKNNLEKRMKCIKEEFMFFKQKGYVFDVNKLYCGKKYVRKKAIPRSFALME